MRIFKRVAMFIVVFMIISMTFTFGNVEAKALKTVTVTTGKSKTISKKSFKRAKKVIVKVSNTKVCKAKYSKKKKTVKITGKKLGSTKVSITVKRKGKKVKRYKYKVKVGVNQSVSGNASANNDVKNALKMVNTYRKAAEVDSLDWSDELYEACLYRLKTSGYDKHEHINRDLSDFFGGFCYTISGYEGQGFAENLAMGQNSVTDAVKAWKKSKGHYRNMIDSDHKSCAIAKYKNMYITIFSDKTAKQIREWRQDIDSGNLAVVTVKELDGSTGGYVSSANITCYDEEDKWNKRVTLRIKSEEGVKLRLEVGHTYYITDKSIGTEEGKVRTVKITVTTDGENVVELVS